MYASFTCNTCNGKFSRKDNLKKHMISAYKTVFKDDCCIDVRTMCNFPGCMESFFVSENWLCNRPYGSSQYSWFYSNLQLRIRIRVPKLERNRRGEKLVYFSKQRGDACGKKFRYVYYNCQRDGAPHIHRPHDKSKVPTGKCKIKV